MSAIGTLTCDNETSRRGAGNTPTALTHLLDLGERGLAVQATRTCSMPNCPKPEKSRRLCTGHYQSEARAGRLGRYPSRRAVTGYEGMHSHLSNQLGPARHYECVDCGGQAREWSYQGGAPDEGDSRHGKFSYSLDFYKPRCHACHQAFDSRSDCKRGHEFTPENTYFGRNQRTCRACKNERQRARRSAQSERLAA